MKKTGVAVIIALTCLAVGGIGGLVTLQIQHQKSEESASQKIIDDYRSAVIQKVTKELPNLTYSKSLEFQDRGSDDPRQLIPEIEFTVDDIFKTFTYGRREVLLEQYANACWDAQRDYLKTINTDELDLDVVSKLEEYPDITAVTTEGRYTLLNDGVTYTDSHGHSETIKESLMQKVPSTPKSGLELGMGPATVEQVLGREPDEILETGYREYRYFYFGQGYLYFKKDVLWQISFKDEQKEYVR